MHYAITTAAVTLSLLAFRGVAQAEPIVYSEVTTASGTLGHESFVNKKLVVTYTGDTASISAPVPGVLQNTGGIAAFHLVDVGAGTLNGGGAVAIVISAQNGFAIGANSTNPNLSPGQNGPGGNPAGGVVLGVNNPAFAGYKLTTALGPLVGAGVLQSNPAAGGNGTPATFSTTAGNLTLTSAANVRFLASTFSEGGGNGEDNVATP